MKISFYLTAKYVSSIQNLRNKSKCLELPENKQPTNQVFCHLSRVLPAATQRLSLWKRDILPGGLSLIFDVSESIRLYSIFILVYLLTRCKDKSLLNRNRSKVECVVSSALRYLPFRISKTCHCSERHLNGALVKTFTSGHFFCY